MTDETPYEPELMAFVHSVDTDGISNPCSHTFAQHEWGYMVHNYRELIRKIARQSGLKDAQL